MYLMVFVLLVTELVRFTNKMKDSDILNALLNGHHLDSKELERANELLTQINTALKNR